MNVIMAKKNRKTATLAKNTVKKNQSKSIDMASLQKEISEELKKQGISSPKSSSHKDKKSHSKDMWVYTGIQGFDVLLDKGIPRGLSVLVCGGPGSGKTIFGLQTLAYGLSQGEKCLYMTFEEAPERLMNHMRDFGWDVKKYIKSGQLIIRKYNIYDVSRQVEAMMEKAKGELLIDIQPLLFPQGFRPDRIVVDSLSAISAAFVGKEDTYRVYIEQLFNLFQGMNTTSFLISETTELPKRLTNSGVEEFLADGVIVMYSIRHGNIRENAIECLKMRGASFKKKIAAMQILSGKGIEVYPEQEIFTEIE